MLWGDRMLHDVLRRIIVATLLVIGTPIAAYSNPQAPNETDQGEEPQKTPIQCQHYAYRYQSYLCRPPLVVQVIPAEQSAEKISLAAAERQEKSAADQANLFFVGMSAIATALMVVVGGLQVGLFVWQLRLFRRSLGDTRIAAEAARDSAITGRTSMIGSNRAYVHYNGCRWISHPDGTTEKYFWRIRPKWTNAGNTPTRKLRVRVSYDLRDDPLPDDLILGYGNSIDVPTTIPPGSEIESNPYDIYAEDIDKIMKGQKYFYFWGIATYYDVFDPLKMHTTKFCCTLTNVTGNVFKGFDEKTNPVHMIFAFHHRHNCSDEDCL